MNHESYIYRLKATNTYQRTPWILELTPKGQSPALVHQWTLQCWIIQPYKFLTFCSLSVYILHFVGLLYRMFTTFDDHVIIIWTRRPSLADFMYPHTKVPPESTLCPEWSFLAATAAHEAQLSLPFFCSSICLSVCTQVMVSKIFAMLLIKCSQCNVANSMLKICSKKISAEGHLGHSFTACNTTHTNCRFQKGCQGAPKWPTGSGKGSTPSLLGNLINFCYLQGVPQYCLHFCFVNISASKAP